MPFKSLMFADMSGQGGGTVRPPSLTSGGSRSPNVTQTNKSTVKDPYGYSLVQKPPVIKDENNYNLPTVKGPEPVLIVNGYKKSGGLGALVNGYWVNKGKDYGSSNLGNLIINNEPITNIKLSAPENSQRENIEDKFVDKTPIHDKKIESKYFMSFDTTDRRSIVTTYDFEYLSYLIFQTNVNTQLPRFHDTVTNIIKDSKFKREEDMPDGDDYTDLMEDSDIKIVLDDIWAMVLANNTDAVKNVVGFYIYFARKTNFLPMLIKGVGIPKFIESTNLESILENLEASGLYPINFGNIFEKIWNSFKYSVNEDGNTAEVVMSLREFYRIESTRNMEQLHWGFVDPVDKLSLMSVIDMRKWANRRTFRNTSLAFNAFKQLSQEYKDSNSNIKWYLDNILPNKTDVFMNRTIMSSNVQPHSPSYNLWRLMETFDSVYKLNRYRVNKRNMKYVFDKFSKDKSFPVDGIASDKYVEFWHHWKNFIDFNASDISRRLTTIDENDKPILTGDATVDYGQLYWILVEMVNSKYILQYLRNNEPYIEYINDKDEIDNITSYVDAAILSIYWAIDSLKKDLIGVVKFIKDKDARFHPVFVK